MFWCTKRIRFHFWWGTKQRDQKHDTGNNRDIISGLQTLQKTVFSDIFLFSYKQCTIVPFLLKNWLAHYKKMSEKSVFRKAWSPEWRHNRSQCPVFGLAVLIPHWKWNLTCLVHQNTGKENRYWKFFFAIHVSTLRRFNQTNKKNSVIRTLKACSLRYSWRLKCTFLNLAIYFCNLHKLTILLWYEKFYTTWNKFHQLCQQRKYTKNLQ